jgi:hypothetical protein
MTVADDASLSFVSGEFSISAWINMVDATNFVIASKAQEYLFWVNASDLLEVRLYDDSASAYIGRSYSTAMTTYQNSWVHVEFNYDGSGASTGINLKVNGVVVDTTDSNTGVFVDM